MSAAFLVTALVVVATPGTGAVYTIGTGLTRGRRGSVIAALGCTLGIIPHMLAAITGLAALVHASATAFAAVRWAGVAFLLYLAWATWRDGGDLMRPGDTTAAEPTSSWTIIRRAILINLLNPKLTVFFFAFLPPFVQPDAGPAWTQMTVLSVVFMALTFAVFAGYGALAAAVRSHVLERPHVMRWLRRGFAAAYVALAGRLALSAR